MSWDDKSTYEEKPKQPIYRHVSTGMQFAIYRIGKKYKSLTSIKGFQKHMERERETLNSNGQKNTILIGNPDVVGTVYNYLKDVKIHKNNVLARELLLTASPSFFRGLSEKELQLWIDQNLDFLWKEYGENCVYAVLHRDESTYHIHALIVPKFFEKDRYFLANSRYFDGIDKFREWQDKYSDKMRERFTTLNRGIRFSKAKHIEIRHFYAMLNERLNDKDIEQLCAKALNSELLEIKIKSIQQTLQTYKNYLSKSEEEKQELRTKNKELYSKIHDISSQKEVFKEALELLSEQYRLPQNAIVCVLKYIENEYGRERSD